MDFVYAALGLVILVLAGDVLVRGAVNVSLRLGVPALIVSLTIVAIGTSAPELLIAIKAVLENAPGIAVGNVVGSNIANVLLVLGLPALISGIGMSDCDSRHSYMQMLAGTALFAAVAFMAPITWLHGVILLTFYSVFIGNAMFSGQRHRKANNNHAAALHDLEDADEGLAWWKITLYLVLGLIGLPWGADILVNSATAIARNYNVSETAIGLTLVAVGTSLPELATTVSAALRRQTAVIMGNVIGSNMANLLAIIGISAFFGDIPVAPEILRFDLWIMVAAALLIAPFILGKVRIGRIWGAGFLALYVIYIYLVLG